MKVSINSRLLLSLLLVIAMLVPTQAFATIGSEEEKNVHYAALGDSITAGVDFNNKIGLSFADYIAQDLQRVELLGSFEKPYAVPGATTMDLLTALSQPEMQFKLQSTNMITISIGANDFLQVLKTEPERLKDPLEVAEIMKQLTENYATSMHIIRKVNPTAQVYLMGYYNGFYAYPEEQQQPLIQLTNTVNEIIKQIALATNSYYVPTFDKIAEDYPTYLPNPSNVHPSPAGYMAIADEFWKQIRTNLPVSTTRIAGENRYETAIKISQAGWKESAQSVILARGDDFPDALSGAPLAYDADSPILLTHSHKLDPNVKEEIFRLNPQVVYILGGDVAISPEVEQEIIDMDIKTHRFGGADRYETSALIGAYLPSSDTAVVANGTKFPDALAVASYAAENAYPIILTKQNEMPKASAKLLKNYPKSLAIGGTAVISEDLFNTLPDATRYGGADRYETASIIARELNPSYKAFVSTGLEFADALTGSVLAAKTESSFLLVHPEKMQDAVLQAKEDLGIYHFTILGGPKAVSPSIETELQGVK
ncbi:cell wall-binding repeat-containing protein [Guptibacillus hwajinpoensis]|nr:cell wall-binding repeat-containing protein [Alkalihalobacillus macyae]